MKKVLLVVALLLLAAPVFAADVTITATFGTISNPSEPNKLVPLTVGWTGAADACSIRAFALRMTADTGRNLDNIRGFKVGESNAVSKGFGIFPGKFRDFIDVQNPTTADWADTNYNPLAPAGDLNSAGGNDNPTMVVELGTLYVGDANAPGTSGTLFVVDVNLEGNTGSTSVCFALEQTRGGVVKKDGTAATVTLPGTGGCVTFSSCVTIPTIVGLTTAAANAAITGAGLTVGTVTNQYSDTVANDIVMTQDTGCVAVGTPVNYKYSLGRFPTPQQIIYPRWDADSNVPVYWSQAAGATRYELERSANGGSTWANAYTGTATFKAKDSKLWAALIAGEHERPTWTATACMYPAQLTATLI